MSKAKIARTFVLALAFATTLTGLATSNRAGQAPPQSSAPTSAEGESIYKQRCAMCHDSPQDRVPPLFLIRRRSAENVIQTLTDGAMKQQATGLNADQIRNLAIYLTGKNPGPPLKADLERNMCAGGIRPLDLKAPQWNGWSL